MKPLLLLLPFLVGTTPAAAISASAQREEVFEDEGAGRDEEQEQFGQSEKPSGHAPACVGGECPASLVETVLYSYGTACSGLDWRFLRQVAVAESGLDPKNHTGKYVGLFQMDTEACQDNIGDFKGFLSCSDLEDPEANTASAADRLDRYFRGRGSYPSIIKSCPGNSPQENMALAYIGHNNGPAVLRHVLGRKACKDGQIRKAVASFYENHPKARDDGMFADSDGKLHKCNARYAEKYHLAGTRAYRCVNAEWGIAKYEYGKRRVAAVTGVSRLYDPAVKGRTLECPSVAGKRVFSKQEIVASIKDGTFKDKPIADPELIARLERRRRKAGEEGGAAYAKAERSIKGWEKENQGLITIAGSSKKKGKGSVSGDAHSPANQLPVRFVKNSASPPEPNGRWASAQDDELETKRRAVVASFGGDKTEKKGGGGPKSLWAAIVSLLGF